MFSDCMTEWPKSNVTCLLYCFPVKIQWWLCHWQVKSWIMMLKESVRHGPINYCKVYILCGSQDFTSYSINILKRKFFLLFFIFHLMILNLWEQSSEQCGIIWSISRCSSLLALLSCKSIICNQWSFFWTVLFVHIKYLWWSY
jgi:hypothetical protein